MKPTGIIRRIDDLGRVIIPKEIRRTLGLREGEPMEISVDKDTVCFTRYTPADGYKETITRLIGNMSEDYGFENQREIIQKLSASLDLLNIEEEH